MQTGSAKVVAIIPARSGSKSVPHKNIRPLGGKPLLVHSIDHALQSKRVERVIVSTDSAEYAEIAKEYGAEVPFIRPLELASDSSTDLEVFMHCLQWLREHEGYVPEICVHLRPTFPIRKAEDIDQMVDRLENRPSADSIRSIVKAEKTPFKMWFMDSELRMAPVVKSDLREPYNMPRQDLPAAYRQNACIDVVRAKVILEKQSMTGDEILGYLMEQDCDIDTESDFQRAGRLLEQQDNRTTATVRQKTYCFDIDGVIAAIVPDNDYAKATPLNENIELINRLYDSGHHIVLFTARGTATGIDWRETTESQMIDWGVKHHRLMFGKPAADFYIDDKLISIEDLGFKINVNQ